MPLLTTLLDDYTASNNPVAGWQTNPDGAAQPTWQSTGGVLVPNAANAWMTSTATYGPDMCATFTLSTVPGAGTVFEVGVRFQGYGTATYNYYSAYIDSAGGVTMNKYVAGVNTVLKTATAPAGYTLENGDLFGCAIRGSNLMAWYQKPNGQCLRWVELRDTSITGTGAISIFTSGTTVRPDNMLGGTLDSTLTLIRRANVT